MTCLANAVFLSPVVSHRFAISFSRRICRSAIPPLSRGARGDQSIIIFPVSSRGMIGDHVCEITRKNCCIVSIHTASICNVIQKLS